MTSKLFVTYKFYICKMCLLSTKDQGKYNEIEDMIPSVNGFVFSEIGHYVELVICYFHPQKPFSFLLVI